MAGFFDGLTATGILSSAVDVFMAKEQGKAAKIEAQTKAAEDAQRRAVESANLSTQQRIVTEKLARQAFDNQQMWKIASWMVMLGGFTLAGATALRIMGKK